MRSENDQFWQDMFREEEGLQSGSIKVRENNEKFTTAKSKLNLLKSDKVILFASLVFASPRVWGVSFRWCSLYSDTLSALEPLNYPEVWMWMHLSVCVLVIDNLSWAHRAPRYAACITERDEQ